MKSELNKYDNINADDAQFISDIKAIVYTAKQKAYQAADLFQVAANWLVGRRIFEQEQHGQERAQYGKHIVELASEALTAEFGKGYSVVNIKSFRKFYLTFNNLLIGQTPSAQSGNDLTIKGQSVSAELELAKMLPSNLSWSHYERLMRIKNEDERDWYMREAAEESWSVRTLNRNIGSQYYNRLLQTPESKRGEVIDEMKRLTADYQKDRHKFLRNPVVAEFLGLASNTDFTESELEKSILTNLQKFLMELGKGYAFVARQQHIHTEKKDYFIDLVFYNYILKCFVLIDLKTKEITHQDVGQMDMYIRMYDELKRSEDDNPTIGIVLCADTDEDVARYSVLHGNEQLFASKYKLYLPTEEELRAEIETQKAMFYLQQKENQKTE